MAAIETERKPEVAKESKEKCTIDSNFAVICAFIEQFGQITGVLCPSIGRLQVGLIAISLFFESIVLHFGKSQVIVLDFKLLKSYLLELTRLKCPKGCANMTMNL